MTETCEMTRSGLIGKAAGSAKEFAGEMIGSDELARAGRHQQARSEGRLREDRFVAEIEDVMLENDVAEADAGPAHERDRERAELTRAA